MRDVPRLKNAAIEIEDADIAALICFGQRDVPPRIVLAGDDVGIIGERQRPAGLVPNYDGHSRRDVRIVFDQHFRPRARRTLIPHIDVFPCRKIYRPP